MFYLAEHIYVLAISRALQGFSAAFLLTAGLSVLDDTVGKGGMGQMSGYAFSSLSCGLIIGPFVGGLVYAKSGYQDVFLMMLGLVLMDTFLRLVMIEKKPALQWLDPMASDEDGRTETVHKSSDSTSTDTSLSSTIVSEHATRQMPSILVLLSSPRILAATYGVFVVCAVSTSFDGVLALFVKKTFDWGSTGAGLIFLTIAVPAVIGPLAGWISDNYGPRWLATSGLLLTAVFAFLLRLVHHDSKGQVILLCVLLTLIGKDHVPPLSWVEVQRLRWCSVCSVGIGLNCCTAPLTGYLSLTVQELEMARPGQFGQNGAYAQAFALLNSAVAAAIVFGPTVAGLIQVKVGWAGSSLVLGALCVSGALPVVRSLTCEFCSQGNRWSAGLHKDPLYEYEKDKSQQQEGWNDKKRPSQLQQCVMCGFRACDRGRDFILDSSRNKREGMNWSEKKPWVTRE